MSALAWAVAGQFVPAASIQHVLPLGHGLINETFKVLCTSSAFVLQRLNAQVFPDPQAIVANGWQLARHIRGKPPELVRLQMPDLWQTLQGERCVVDADQQVWRAMALIEPAESRQVISQDQEAVQIGAALGHFHALCADLPLLALQDTLPGFHETPRYFAWYEQCLRDAQVVFDADFERCREFVERYAGQVFELDAARLRGELSCRVIHGDPKLNNFLFRPNSSEVVSLIDLDTVKPGLLHYDIADCLRSCCHDKRDNHFDLPRCELILRAYLQEAAGLWTAADYAYLCKSIWLLPFELGLRFLSDYLQGDLYFKVTHARQNLQRAEALFALCESIERQQSALQRLIAELGERFVVGLRDSLS